MKVKLREIAEYVNIKINSNNLSLNNYISTENMLPDRKGISMSSNIPNNNVNKFLKNDILISNIRPYFKKIWFAIFEGGASNDILVIRGNNKVNSKYLYYLLSTDDFFDYNVKGSKGTKMPRGDKEHIMNYEFKLPSLKEQKRIGNILTALDDKIELNNQMNQTLEEIASLLYKRWFVDFEFPDDKGNPYKSSGGEMVDSELGMIPKGWEVKELGEIIKFIKGKKPNKIKENKVVGYERYMTIKGITNTEILYADLENTIKIGHNDVSMVMDGASSGDIYTNIEGVLSSTFSKIETEVPNSYIFQVLNYYESDIKKNLTGSAIPHTDKGYINRLLIVVPKNLLLEKLSKKFAFFIQYINGNIKESNVLSEQKKIILKILI